MTARQNHCLTLLRDLAATGQPSPSYQQLADALGLKSKAGVHRIVTALTEQRLIRRRPGRARSLEVVGGTLSAEALAWCERNPERVEAMMVGEGA